MYRAVNGRDRFQAQLQGIQAQETRALDRVLELMENMADYTVWNHYLSRGERTKPFHMLDYLDIFVVYYDSNWETILLIWWIGTLKVLILEGHQVDGNTQEITQPTPEDIGDHHIEVETGDLELEEIEVLSSSYDGSLSEEKSTNFEDENTVRQSNSEGVELRNRALWLMAYVCRLLTVCPELLPTHLELTKKKVAKELKHIHYQITNAIGNYAPNWMEDTRRKVESVKLPPLKFGERRSKEVIDETIANMRKEGIGNVDSKVDLDRFGTELAVLLVDRMSLEDRWALIEGTAAHFVACLANASRTVEHCAKLTQGGELLTFLWILFSHMGGGSP